MGASWFFSNTLLERRHDGHGKSVNVCTSKKDIPKFTDEVPFQGLR